MTTTPLSATTVATALVVLGLTSCVGCASAVRRGTGGADPGAVSIAVENHSSETLDVYLSNAGSGNVPLGRVHGLSRLVARTSSSVLRHETVLYGVPSNGTLSPFDNYATRPFTLGAARDVLWMIEAGRRLSAVNVH